MLMLIEKANDAHWKIISFSVSFRMPWAIIQHTASFEIVDVTKMKTHTHNMERVPCLTESYYRPNYIDNCMKPLWFNSLLKTCHIVNKKKTEPNRVSSSKVWKLNRMSQDWIASGERLKVDLFFNQETPCRWIFITPSAAAHVLMPYYLRSAFSIRILNIFLFTLH